MSQNINQPKVCLCCDKTKVLNEFPTYQASHVGVRYKNLCKLCDLEAESLRKKDLRRCLRCKNIKELIHFRTQKTHIRRICKDCHTIDRQFDKSKWKIKNREKHMATRIRHQAKKDNIPFDITADDIHIPKFCPILGIELKFNDGQPNSSDYSPSLDKLVPEKGYIKGNIQVISNRANRLKSNGTALEHEKIAKWMREQGCD